MALQAMPRACGAKMAADRPLLKNQKEELKGCSWWQKILCYFAPDREREREKYFREPLLDVR